MTVVVTAAELRARLIAAAGELALVDVRGVGRFAAGHILLASNAPLCRLELDFARLVPRRSAPVVLADEAGAASGPAARAAAVLARAGYADVSVLEGGVRAWRDAGFALFEGVHVPSKAFGEAIEATCATPHMTAAELAALQAAGRDLVVLDSRPLDEYQRMSIPGGIDVPGAELVHRIHDLAPDPGTLVVVNCAGRTRSIIGAQSLIDAGVPNPVVALENGTMGWTLAGLELEHGQARTPPPPSAAGRAWARSAAARVASRFAVPRIDRATLGMWAADPTRTLYLCDVRSPAEYQAGHLPGSRSTPGGQLVQATDGFLGTRGARIVLVDDDGVRATMTGSWLRRMGWRDVHVLERGLDGAGLATGPEPIEVLGQGASVAVAEITVAELADRAVDDGLAILDFADGQTHVGGHLPGAWGVSRTRLDQQLAKLPPARNHVLTSPDGRLARLAAPEVERLVAGPVRVVAGGTEAWTAAGFSLAGGGERLVADPEDVHLRAYDLDDPAAVEQAMRAYLAWETDLMPQLERDGTLRFFS